MLGLGNKIKKIFYNDSWTINDDQTWRKIHFPLSPYYTWRGLNRKYLIEYILQIILKYNKMNQFYLGRFSTRQFTPYCALIFFPTFPASSSELNLTTRTT